MSEPPVEVNAEGVEAKPRKVGHRWADLAIALSAIAISLVSLTVAVHHGQIQERLVAANSWPYLTYITSNGGLGEERGRIVLAIENAGTGPALLQNLIVRYKGQVVHHPQELLQLCCGVMPGGDLRRGSPPPAVQAQLAPSSVGSAIGVYKPSMISRFLEYRDDPTQQSVWKQLDVARTQLKFEACYCSVLGECFRSDLVSMDPEPVDECPARGADTFAG